VADQVRPAEFSDLQGLIQGLSTGIQGALDKRERRQAGQVAAGRVLRLAPRPVLLAGREDLLAGLDARLAGANEVGPRVAALCGLGGVGKASAAVEYAHRQLQGPCSVKRSKKTTFQIRGGRLAAEASLADRRAARHSVPDVGLLATETDRSAE
jgi:hypothetical protein